MPNRPTTDVMRGSPVTEFLEGAPGRIPASPRLSVGPQLDERHVLDEGIARTEYDSGFNIAARRPLSEPVAGASTDLGAARDSLEVEREEKKRSTWVFALPVIALVGVGAVVIGMSKGGPATPPAATTSAAATSPPTVPLQPPTASLPAPSSSVTTAPSAAPSSSSSPSPPRASASAAAVRTPRSPPMGTSVLDTTIKN